MDFEPERAAAWRTPVVMAVVVAGVVVVGSILLGGQVSGILSTVGASVGSGSTAGGRSSGGGGSSNGGGSPQDGGQSAGGETGGGSGTGQGAGAAAAGDVPLLDVTRPELLVTKTGEIALHVDAIDPAISAASEAMTALGGYLSGSSRSGTGEDASASATFRVPVAAWDDALIAIRALGDVVNEQTETEDVTATVVDLEARVRNLQATEAALQAILTDATTIDDILRVQDELTPVRGEIEQLQSRAANLRDQAAMSTITVFLGLESAPVVARPERGFDAAAEADAATAYLVKIGEALTKVGIWFSIVWLPLLVGLAIVGGMGLLVTRWLWRRRSGGPEVASGIGPA